MRRAGWILLGLVVAGLLVVASARVVRSLRMTRGAVACFTGLVASANAQDLDLARSLCSAGYLASHRIEGARGGGLVGLPRNIHRNFRAWPEGEDVWLCPTDRVGPVYRLVREGGAWKFDGLVGLLGPGGRVAPAEKNDGEDGSPPVFR